jgi:NAD(P)-dependent dehydrogenase (short-subunit alcohol dehydrogenase family)
MPEIAQRFADRMVMVTGAGTGFGAEIAVRAAQEGARTVVVHYRSSAAGAEATAERVRAEGSEALLVRGDIVSWEDIKRMAGTVDAELGSLDALINNVGDRQVRPARPHQVLRPGARRAHHR